MRYDHACLILLVDTLKTMSEQIKMANNAGVTFAEHDQLLPDIAV